MRFKTKTIGEVAEVQTGPFGSQLHKEDYVEAGTPIVSPTASKRIVGGGGRVGV